MSIEIVVGAVASVHVVATVVSVTSVNSDRDEPKLVSRVDTVELQMMLFARLIWFRFFLLAETSKFAPHFFRRCFG